MRAQVTVFGLLLWSNCLACSIKQIDSTSVGDSTGPSTHGDMQPGATGDVPTSGGTDNATRTGSGDGTGSEGGGDRSDDADVSSSTGELTPCAATG